MLDASRRIGQPPTRSQVRINDLAAPPEPRCATTGTVVLKINSWKDLGFIWIYQNQTVETMVFFFMKGMGDNDEGHLDMCFYTIYELFIFLLMGCSIVFVVRFVFCRLFVYIYRIHYISNSLYCSKRFCFDVFTSCSSNSKKCQSF